jgi:fatty-acyl-CoA synthase
MRFSTSHWPVDFSQPVVDVTVGDALRGAAAEAPHATALMEGAVDPATRRRWSWQVSEKGASQPARVGPACSRA